GPEHHVAVHLVEELLARIDVKVLARVRAAYHHDDEVAVAESALVADRRPQLRAVGVDPLPQVECLQGLHVASVPPYVTRKGNEESDRCNPERRIPLCRARCCAPWLSACSRPARRAARTCIGRGTNSQLLHRSRSIISRSAGPVHPPCSRSTGN